MVIGEYHSTIGSKNRVAIPAKIREGLGRNIILTRGYEGALILVNKKMWTNIASEVMNGSFINKNIRDTSRFLVGSAVEANPDKQGRIVIPQSLFDHAELINEKELVFIGLVNWVEIWSKCKWEERLEMITADSEKIADELSKQFNEK